MTMMVTLINFFFPQHILNIDNKLVTDILHNYSHQRSDHVLTRESVNQLWNSVKRSGSENTHRVEIRQREHTSGRDPAARTHIGTRSGSENTHRDEIRQREHPSGRDPAARTHIGTRSGSENTHREVDTTELEHHDPIEPNG